MLLSETMAAVGATPGVAVEPSQSQTTGAAAPWRLGRTEAAGIVAGLFVAVALIALINHLTPAQEAPRPVVQPTVAASVLPAPTQLPTIAPTAAAVMVVGWAAPDGAVLGPVPLPAAATARFGDDWLGFPWQGGMVWIRRAD